LEEELLKLLSLKNKLISLFVAPVLVTTSMSLMMPVTSYAAGTISVSSNPTVRPTGPNLGTSLGTVLITIPQGAIQNGDQVTMTLPHGISFHTPFDPILENDSASLKSLNATYVIAGFDHGDLAGTTTSFGNNQVTIKVTQTGVPTGDFKLAIRLGDITIDGASDGPVNITFDAPSTSAFPTTAPSDGTTTYIRPAQPSGQQTQTIATTPAPISTSITPVTQNPEKPKPKSSITFTEGNSIYTIDGSNKSMDVAPYINKGRLMLPIRYVAEALGVPDVDINWSNQLNMVTVKKDSHQVSFIIGQQNYIKDGETIYTDAKAEIHEGRVTVPFRYLAEVLDTEVSWDDRTRTATLLDGER
jgi:hypothetical protein